MKENTLSNLVAVADRFRQCGNVTGIREHGSGNINSTYLVTLDAGTCRPATCSSFILQRINTKVFPKPELVMLNMRTATKHLRLRQERIPPTGGRCPEFPRVLLTHDGTDHWRGPDGSFWRALSFIENAQSYDTVRNNEHAKEIGSMLGTFHNLLSDLPPDLMADTLEGFHITPAYLRHYDEVYETCQIRSSPELDYCIQIISERRDWARVLENAKGKGSLNIRTIHGDPKVNNFMMDSVTGQAVSLLDLDTVKPGLVHYDIGDCLRSGCNPLGEETEQWEEVYFESDICQTMLQGYLSVAREFLTGNDYQYMYDAIRLLAFELGLRFFTDYLGRNVYFKVNRPEHNLARALVQFRLTESIESLESSIRAVIRDVR